MLQAFTASPGRWTRTEADLHDSTVLTYLAWASLRSGSRDVGAALRSVAIATGIPSSTVDRSLRRLHAAGWIPVGARPTAPTQPSGGSQTGFPHPSYTSGHFTM